MQKASIWGISVPTAPLIDWLIDWFHNFFVIFSEHFLSRMAPTVVSCAENRTNRCSGRGGEVPWAMAPRFAVMVRKSPYASMTQISRTAGRAVSWSAKFSRRLMTSTNSWYDMQFPSKQGIRLPWQANWRSTSKTWVGRFWMGWARWGARMSRSRPVSATLSGFFSNSSRFSRTYSWLTFFFVLHSQASAIPQNMWSSGSATVTLREIEAGSSPCMNALQVQFKIPIKTIALYIFVDLSLSFLNHFAMSVPLRFDRCVGNAWKKRQLCPNSTLRRLLPTGDGTQCRAVWITGKTRV